MVIVPHGVIEDLQQRQRMVAKLPPPPEIETTLQLDRDMRTVLDRADMSEAEKAYEYGQMLQRYRLFRQKAQEVTQTPRTTSSIDPPKTTEKKEEKTEETGVSPTTKDKVSALVMESVPKAHQKKAELLLGQIRTHPHMSWNSQGQLLYRGNVVPDSHLADLVNDTIRKRRSVGTPPGWDVFAKGLREINIPHEIVGNPDRWKWMQTHADDASAMDSPIGHSTPIRLQPHKSTTKSGDSAYESELASNLSLTPDTDVTLKTPSTVKKSKIKIEETPGRPSRFSPNSLIGRWINY